MKMKNIKRTFILISIFFIVTVSSQTSGVFDNEIFTPFYPLDPTSTPITRPYNLALYRVNLAPDGFIKEIFSVNGQYPGPIIHVNKGDRIYANVTNYLGEETAIHWHGLLQKGTNWYDGVPGQSQCPIQNGVSFAYDFQTFNQSGTYWYHAHIHGQYMEGLRGPLIIHDPDDPFRSQYDYEYVVTMSDWYHEKISDLIAERLAPGYNGLNPIPDAALLSGVGRYNCSAAPPQSNCTTNNLFGVYKFTPSKRYRLRLINTSGLGHFQFSIDNHQLWIIEADGEYTKPVVVNKLPVAIGQRYSVIVNASQPISNYWIRATLESGCLLRNQDTLNIDSAINYNGLGILRYDGAPEITPNTTEWNDKLVPCVGVDLSLLKSFYPRPVPTGPSTPILLNVTLRDNEDNSTRAYINNSTYVADNYNPTIERLVNEHMTISQLSPSQNIYPLNISNGIYDIQIINSNSAPHPFHIHGHNFFVIGSGPGQEINPNLYNLKDPFPRDTFALGGSSWGVFRYVADNPGVWSIHCHIDWHVEMGMIAQIIELPDQLVQLKVPQEVTNLCASPKSPKSATSEDSATTSPKSVKKRRNGFMKI